MCGETRIPRDMCAGNTHPWETHIPVTAVILLMLWGNGILVCSNGDTLQLTKDSIPFMVIIVLVKTITLTVLVRVLKEALISGTILNQLLTKKVTIYSTNLFIEAVQEAIEKHDSDKAPFFIYAAYQAVHDPLEAPQEYIDQCQSIPYENRCIFCGTLKAADEGISNITMLLKEKNLLDDTISLYLVQTMEVRLQQVVAIGH